MYLSNRDMKWAIDCGKLICRPRPEELGAGYDETSIDLHLGSISQNAKVWDIENYKRKVMGRDDSRRHAEIALGSFDWTMIGNEFLIPVPPESTDLEENNSQLVFSRGNEVIVRRFGFVLWSTKEVVGTPVIQPEEIQSQRHPELICFVNAKSTRARTGLLVHFTAPTIHANWAGAVTLEITNIGPFDFVLRENDVIAQLTVATISSAPDLNLKKNKAQTQGQTNPKGAATPKAKAKKK